MLAGLGFRHVEPFGGLFNDAGALKSALDANGLDAPTTHIGIPALREDFDGTLAKLREVGVEIAIVPAVPPEERVQDRAGWETLGAELLGYAKRATDAGLHLRLAQPQFRIRAPAGRVDAARMDPGRRPGSQMAGGHRLGDPRRAGPEAVDRALCAARRGLPREGSRAGRRERRRGWLGGCRPWRVSTGPRCCRSCARRQRRSGRSSTTTRRTMRGSRAAPSRRSRPGERDHARARCRDRRLRRHLDDLHAEHAALRRPASRSLRGHAAGGGEGAGREVRHRCAPDRRPAEARRYRHRRQPHGAQRAFRRQPCGAHRRQACVHGKAAHRLGRGRAQARRGGGSARTLARLRAGHVPRRGRAARAADGGRGQGRAHPRGQRLPHVARHGALAPRSGVLLQARRRPDPRSRALLHRRARQPARPRGARAGAGHERFCRADRSPRRGRARGNASRSRHRRPSWRCSNSRRARMSRWR